MFRISKLLFYLLVISIIVLSCKESTPVSQEEHAEASGFNLYQDNKIIFKMYNLNIDTNIAKSFIVQLSNNLSIYEVRFLDSLGKELSTYEVGNGLNVIIEDTTLVQTLVTSPMITDISKIMPFTFSAIGLKKGSSQITIRLDHHGHEDFTSPKFPIVVN